MLIAICAAATAMLKPYPFVGWGAETLDVIRKSYLLSDGKLFADSVENGKKSGPAFNWGVGVLLGAMNDSARFRPETRPQLRAFVEATRVYWNTKGPVPGYDVLPGPKDVDRYYDDNQWMVLELVAASEVLEEPKFLGYAKETLKYVLSGEDKKLGGGIYWHETKKTEKNTCSNAPAAAACLALWAHTKDPALLAKAKQLYAWTKKNLRDPADGLMWDGKKLNGLIVKDKWSYNTALMIRTAMGLWGATHERVYLDDANHMVAASVGKWVNPVTGALKDEGRFAHLLMESWILARDGTTDKRVVRALNALHGFRDSTGRYGKRFDALPAAGQTKFELIDQASAARAYFVGGHLPTS
jgi:hypothetical protein